MAASVALFGNFGTRNLGNECTLQAIIHNIRALAPDARVSAICLDPEDTEARHNIPAVLMSYRYLKDFKSRVSGRSGPMIRALRRLLIRVPVELVQCLKAFRVLKGTDMLVMTGTGMLDDFGIHPLGLHYEILKWSLIAKLRGCKLLFVSVGAGQVSHPLSRWLVKAALSLADYRSYRDLPSKDHLHRMGLNTSRDAVYPDLAFSLPRPQPADPHGPVDGARVIGLGLMEYYGRGCSRERGERIYGEYVDKVATFAAWLLERGYTVRLLIGDLVYDARVKDDVVRALQVKRVRYEQGQLIDEPVTSVEQLLSQLETTDVVVGTRFHSVLLALMLSKPALSISYDTKNDSLMADVGLAEYCQQIDRVDVDALVEQFTALTARRTSLRPYIEQKADAYRRALAEQYRVIFAPCGVAAS